jgi:hypothetical protein
MVTHNVANTSGVATELAKHVAEEDVTSREMDVLRLGCERER